MASLAFSSFMPEFTEFEDMDLVRVAKDPVSVYKDPSDTSQIIRTWVRDDLIHVYGTVNSGTPGYNPIWYRVFGGYMHRARLQKVQVQYNMPLSSVPATKILAELTIPYTQAYRYNKLDGWYSYYRLYYSSTQWITGIETGPDGRPWYVVQDDWNVHRVSHLLEMLVEPFLRWLVVVRSDEQHAVCARFLSIPRELQRLGGRVRTRARDHRHALVHRLHGELYHAVVFLM